jgi:type IV pilus assembly protein PilV
MKGNLGNQHGFTLVELVIAISLMAIGVFAVIGVQIVALQSNSIANQLSVANTLAQDALEDILSWDAGNPAFKTNVTPISTAPSATPYAGFPGTSAPLYTYTDSNSGSYNATYSTMVGTATNGVPIGTTSVSVTVTYKYKGSSKSITLSGFKVTV